MINVDTRILSKVTESQFWFLLHIVKRIGPNRNCWPSNKTLCNDTGWNIDKLQKVKKELIEMKLIQVEPQMNLSNVYTLKTKLLKVFVEVDGIQLEESPTGKSGTLKGGVKSGKGYTGKSGNEVLAIEVLVNKTDSNESVDQQPELFEVPKPEKKKTKWEAAPGLFALNKKYWLEVVHPGWSWNGGLDGRMMNEIIRKIEDRHIQMFWSLTREGLDGQGNFMSKEVTKVNIPAGKQHESFVHFCKSLPEFYKTQDLKTLNYKFDGIIEQIKSGRKPGGDYSSRNSADRFSDFYGKI